MLPQNAQHQQARGAAAALDKPSIGSLFVPVRAPAARQRTTAVNTLAPGSAWPTLSLPPWAQRRPQQQQPQQPQPEPLVVQPPSNRAIHMPASAAAAGVKPKLKLSWAGSGIYFWWQLGAMSYLMQHFDLSKLEHRGASGGGFAAILAKCGVDPEHVMDSAYALSKQHAIWERPLGLVGVWGAMIEAWLHDLLPADAAERCRGEVGIVVTQLPFCSQVAISDFSDKADLVNVAMASAHVPLFLDWKASRPCRGVACVDGSFPDFFSGENCGLLRFDDAPHAMFDYFFDANIVRNGRMDMLELKEFKEFKKIILLGYRYAKRLHDEGELDKFDTSDVDKRLLL